MHDENRYEVTFNGRFVSDLSSEQVKSNLIKLFKSSEQTIEKLFSGNTVTIQKGLTEEKALSYQRAMHKAGAIANVIPMIIEETINLAAPPLPQEDEKKVRDHLQDNNLRPPPVVQDDNIEFDKLTAPPPAAETNAADPLGIAPADQWKIDPVGSRMSKPKRYRSQKEPVTDHLELLPPKSEVGQMKHPVQKVDPDISHLNVSETGSRLSESTSKDKVDIPDTSHLEMGKLGENVGQAKEITEQINPDISHYNLAENTEYIPQLKKKKTPVKPDISHLSLDKE